MFLAEPGGRAGRGKHERPREKRTTLPFCHQSKGRSSGNELFVMKMSMSLSLASHYSNLDLASIPDAQLLPSGGLPLALACI